jgi:hypothetical protein
VEICCLINGPAALPVGKEPWHPVNKGLWGHQGWFDRLGLEKYLMFLPRIETHFVTCAERKPSYYVRISQSIKEGVLNAIVYFPSLYCHTVFLEFYLMPLISAFNFTY